MRLGFEFRPAQYLVKLFEGPLAFSFDSSRRYETVKNHDTRTRIGDRYHPDELIRRTLRSNVTLLHNLLCISYKYCGNGRLRYSIIPVLCFISLFWRAFSDGGRRCSTATCVPRVRLISFSFLFSALGLYWFSSQSRKSFYPFRFTSQNSFKA